MTMVGERLPGLAHSPQGVLGERGADGQLPDALEAPLAEDLSRRLGRGGEHADAATVLIPERDEGEGEVSLLCKAPAVEEERLVL